MTQSQPNGTGWLKMLAQTPPTQSVQLLQTAAGDYSLLYQGVYLHSPEGAVAEARETAQKGCKPALRRSHLILGIGLGYLLEAVYQRSPGHIVIYEPDLALLKFILENVDLAEYLGSGRVQIACSVSEALNALSPHLASEDPLDILITPGLAQLLHQEIPGLMDSLMQLAEDRIRDYKTGLHFHGQWTRQFFQNLPHFSQATPFATLESLYHGKPALIIGRGPSLDSALDDIQALADSMTLIAAGSALQRLYQADITPDFAVFYDANGTEEQLHGLPDAYLQEITLCLSPFTGQKCFKTSSRVKLLGYPQSGEAFAQWLATAQPQNPRFNAPLILEGGGTVSLIAMQLAQTLHSSSIILIGQDLAFPNNRVYAGGIAVQQDAEGRLALEKRENLYTAPEAMTLVPGQDGQPLPALKAYAGFIRHFEKLAEENARQAQPISLYNTSLGGAAIGGYDLKPLASFRGQFAPFKQEPEFISAFYSAFYRDKSESPKFERDNDAQTLRLSVSRLQQDLREAIQLHEATLQDSQPTVKNARERLFNFLNEHPLISHFLMFEMMAVQQRYNPNASSPDDVAANQALLKQNTLNCIDLLRNQILPQVITAEAQLLQAIHLVSTPQKSDEFGL